MRFGVVVVLAVLTTAACGVVADATPTPPAQSCAGYAASNPTIRLTNANDGTSVTAKLCDSIVVVLSGPEGFVGPSPGWQFPQSSDTSVLEVVPLPLPHPANGGVEAVYLAKHPGRATLTAVNGISSCPPNAMCLAPRSWSVTVTVIP